MVDGVGFPLDEQAWAALTADERVGRVVLTKIRGRESCHLSVFADPYRPTVRRLLPVAETFRGTLSEVLTDALVWLESLERAS